MKDRPICGACDKPMRNSARTPAGLIRWKCIPCNYSTTQPNTTLLGYDKAQVKTRLQEIRANIKEGTRTFIVTSAQNNTPIFKPFFASLQHLLRHRNAELLVIPVHYKNISLFTQHQQYIKSWADEVKDYLIDQNLHLGANVNVMGHHKINATAANPLQGISAIGGNRWCIYGHSQIGMLPVATPIDRLPKRIYTCGAITQKNYSQTKDGFKAEFHHVNGALLVEIDKGKAFIREIRAESDGSFYDLDELYTPDGMSKGHSILSLTTGDEHVKWQIPSVKAATYTGGKSISHMLNPQYIVRHDILDQYFASHHHEKSPLLQFKKFYKKDDDGKAELDQVIKFLEETTIADATNLIVHSNHHDHLDLWLDRADAKKDHRNAMLILELQTAQREALTANKDHRALRLYVEPRYKGKIQWLTRNKPFMIGGVDFSQHGDTGINGSRGSASALAKATHKMVIGHSHGACIVKGVHQVGTSAGTMEYEQGLSTHSNTHAIQYQNGKVTLIDILGGQWCASWHYAE